MLSSESIKKIVFLIVVFSSVIFPQRLLKLSVSVEGDTKHVPYVLRNDIVYASAKELAKSVSGNYYYSTESAKLELKFTNYTLKVTARNQFIILTERVSKSKHVYQIPLSTMLVKGDVYIPLKYCLLYLNLAAEREIKFNEDKKHLAVTKRVVDTYTYLEKPGSNVPKPVETQTPKPADSGYDISGVSVAEKSNGTLIRVNSSKELHKFSSSITEGKLYLFLSGVTVDPDVLKDTKNVGLVKSIAKREVSGNTQFEFTLKEGYAAQETFQDIGSNDLLITIHNQKFKAVETDLTDEKNKWLFDTIVIDPGHGGKDPGAIGVSGVREKDINLKISLKLGELIKKKMPGIKVVFTRDNDSFVELFKRGKIANEADGKFFISVHCNSMPKKPSSTSGFEAYLLRPGRTKRAIEIAEFENSVIQYEDNPDRYQKLTDENFILVSMAHSAYMRYSEKFSDILNNNWMRSVKIPSRGIKQAGFYVLVGASMPGVLIETGFLSNRNEEKYLNSSKGQASIADAIYNSIIQYKNYYDETLDEEG